MCLISLLYVEAPGSVKLKSIQLLSEAWCCGTPCETFRGARAGTRRLWNQCAVRSTVRWESRKSNSFNNADTSQGQFGRVLKSFFFAVKSWAGPWKKSCSATWIQNPEVLWLDRHASASSVAAFILFDVRMRNSSSHGRWKCPQFPLLLLCFTQGPGLRTHTKWEECMALISEWWMEGDKTGLILLSFKCVAWDNRAPKVKLALNLIPWLEHPPPLLLVVFVSF